MSIFMISHPHHCYEQDKQPVEEPGTIIKPLERPQMKKSLRPDQFNLLLLAGYYEVKIGPSDRKKKQKKSIIQGVVIDHNLI